MSNTEYHGTYDEYQVKCPYCGYILEDMYPEPSGEYNEKECDACEMKFMAMAEVSYSSKRSCEANLKECDWQLDDRMNGWAESEYIWFKCPACLDTKIKHKEVTTSNNPSTIKK
jgi:ribosomal protein S27E